MQGPVAEHCEKEYRICSGEHYDRLLHHFNKQMSCVFALSDYSCCHSVLSFKYL